MSDRKIIPIKFVKESESATIQHESPRSSYYFLPEMFAPDIWTVDFTFINWPNTPSNRVTTITVASSSPRYFANYKIVLNYLPNPGNTVIRLDIAPDKSKTMSPVSYASLSYLDVVDSTLNNYVREDPNGYIYLKFSPLDPAKWEEKSSQPNFIKWAILKYETTLSDTVSMSVDQPADIANWKPSYFQLT